MGSDQSKPVSQGAPDLLERYCCAMDLCSAKLLSDRAKRQYPDDYSAGPGIVFAVQNGKNNLIVDSLLSGGSAEAQVAEQVGIGDTLISVDDSDVHDLSHAEIVRLVRGPPDTKVTLGLCRATEESGTPGQSYVVYVQRSTTRPVLQHAFGSRKRGFHSSTTRTFLVM